MSQRTFLRRFQDATGTTPARWLLNERLLRAKDYLESSRLSIDSIAEQTGFGQASTCVTIFGSSSPFPRPSIANTIRVLPASGRIADKKNRHNMAVNACMDRFVFWSLRPDTPWPGSGSLTN